MSEVAMTGAGGFLGWHTRAALREQGLTATPIAVGADFRLDDAASSLDGVSRVIHIAGVNRASDEQVREGNVEFAEQLGAALRAAPTPPRTLVYANSTQAENGSPYGDAKARAAEILAATATDLGIDFIDARLPNLFGEHGRPFYNAVTATFCHLLANGEQPSVEQDKGLTLLHAQNAADILTGSASIDDLATLSTDESVSGLLQRLRMMAAVYAAGEIPDIADPFDRDLFNTYRSYTFDSSTPISLTRKADARGSFFEVIRSHGGCGQASFSTTIPGVTRGDHFHRRKVERFTVLSGEATISLRRLFTSETVSFVVGGDRPEAVDMPTMWAHNITNIGADALYTAFWSNDIFDPANPDTIAEVV